MNIINKTPELKIFKKIPAKIIIIIFNILTITILTSLWIILTFNIIKNEALKDANEKTQIMTDITLSVHKYFSDILKPHLFNKINKGEFPDEFDPTWMSSSYVIDNIKKNFKDINKKGYEYNHYAINARNPAREAFNEEKAFLIEMNNNPDLIDKTFIKKENGIKYFYFLKKGETIKKSCLKCHGNPEDAPKDLVAIYGNKRGFNKKIDKVISVETYKIPLRKIIINNINTILLFSVLFLFFLILLLFFKTLLLNKLFFIPLKKINNQFKNISFNTNYLQKNIVEEYSPELNDIIKSFNKMNNKLYQLYCSQEEIINDRTTSLQETNERLENLMKESHHRIKNNLSLISGIINLKKVKINSTNTKNILNDINSKINTISLIHESIYKNNDFTIINTKSHITALFNNLISINNIENNNLKKTINIISINIPLKFMVDLSLIISELTINAFKYGLNKKNNNYLNINLNKNADILVLIVENSINKTPVLKKFNSSNSLGFNIIKNIVKSYNGNIEIILKNSVKILIEFPKKNIK